MKARAKHVDHTKVVDTLDQFVSDLAPAWAVQGRSGAEVRIWAISDLHTDDHHNKVFGSRKGKGTGRDCKRPTRQEWIEEMNTESTADDVIIAAQCRLVTQGGTSHFATLAELSSWHKLSSAE